ncbi:MAG: hypothetical protein V4734_06060, partial [Terriglobus sp.]
KFCEYAEGLALQFDAKTSPPQLAGGQVCFKGSKGYTNGMMFRLHELPQLECITFHFNQYPKQMKRFPI